MTPKHLERLHIRARLGVIYDQSLSNPLWNDIGCRLWDKLGVSLGLGAYALLKEEMEDNPSAFI